MNVCTELEKIAHIYGGVHTDTKRKRRRRQKRLLSELMHDYAQNSTLHGLRYMVQRGLSVAERLFWFVTVVISIVLSLMCIYDAYHKWATSPVIVTVNEKQAYVGKVPFPSVMVCPVIKVNPNVYNFTEMKQLLANSTLSNDELAEFFHISAMCDDYFYIKTKNNWTDVSFITDITKVALDQEQIFKLMSWNGQYNTFENKGESNFFKKVYTAEGVCYVANSLAATDIFKNTTQREYPYMESDEPQVGWSLENGYNYSVRNPYPKRGHVSSSIPNIELILMHDPAYQDIGCNQLFSGFKIYLHHPADFPQSSLYYYAAVPDRVTSLAISFHEMNSESSLSKYSPEIRQCYFPEERKLRYFKIYTEKNCQAECLSNYTFADCNCVDFYMPHDNSNQLCSMTLAHILCIEAAKGFMAENERDADSNLNNIDLCRCLPACNSVQYDAEVLKTRFHLTEKLQQPGFSDYWIANRGRKYSMVNLYFKKPQFVTMQRRELISKIDLLADIGGLLGLFLGFSFLSLIEIIYFLTLRVGYTLKRDLDKEKQNSNQTDEDNKLALVSARVN